MRIYRRMRESGLGIAALLLSAWLSGCGGGGTSQALDGTIGTQSLAAPALENTGSATLEWVAPTTRANGSSFTLSQLGGYKIYIGTDAINMVPAGIVNDPSVTSFTIEGIQPGEYVFAITAFDSEGAESSLSNEVTKIVN